MTLFRVQYAPAEGEEWVEVRQQASTPVEAARLALGEVLVKGTGRRLPLRAKVYFNRGDGATSLVRLYKPPPKPQFP